MDMNREIRDARARLHRAAIKSAAPAMRRDFWRLKEQQRLEAGSEWR